jgi:hypothetical protein
MIVPDNMRYLGSMADELHCQSDCVRDATGDARAPLVGRGHAWRFCLAAIGVGVLVGIVAIEALLRFVGPVENIYVGVPHPQWHHWYRANLHYLVVPEHGELGGHAVDFNADGMPMRADLPSADVVSVVFLGDSFTAAMEVTESYRFVSLVGRRLPVPALNFGCRSFSPILTRLMLEHFSERINPTAMVLQLCTNDIHDDLIRSQLAVRDDEGRIIAVPPSTLELVASHSRLVQLAVKGYRIRSYNRDMQQRTGGRWVPDRLSPAFTRPIEDWYTSAERAPFEGDILEIARWCRQRNCRLWLMPIPDRGNLLIGETDYFVDYCRKFAAEHEIAVIDLEPAFRRGDVAKLFFRVDSHLTPVGHGVVAQVILDGLLPALADVDGRSPVPDPH